ncbi:MbcA/ParS/Xre antitoxin family protein [Oceanibaculum nanhaiense]|uniref:MbcA/ParS/Xre antitoxin family protein n=1 Tax=Oceanibaculum nanhaiense TaxID=1909734 RepID=UPI003D2C6F57
MPYLRLLETPARELAPQYTEDEYRAMQRAFIGLAQKWQIEDREAAILMGDISERTFRRWKAGELGRPAVDIAARLSNLMGIHKALRLLFREPERGYAWIRRPNDAFSGRSALDIMLDGQLTDLMRVRRYLDAQRSAW